MIAIARRPRYPASNKRRERRRGERKKRTPNNQNKKLLEVIFCAVGSCDAPIREDKAAAIVRASNGEKLAHPPLAGYSGSVQASQRSTPRWNRNANDRTERIKKKNGKGWMGREFTVLPRKTSIQVCDIFYPVTWQNLLVTAGRLSSFLFLSLSWHHTTRAFFLLLCVLCGEKKVVGDISNISFWNIATVHDLKCGCTRRHRCEEAGGEKKFDT